VRKRNARQQEQQFFFTDQNEISETHMALQILAKFAQSMQIPAKQRPPAVNSG
jgi:hypothetical protein